MLRIQQPELAACDCKPWECKRTEGNANATSCSLRYGGVVHVAGPTVTDVFNRMRQTCTRCDAQLTNALTGTCQPFAEGEFVIASNDPMKRVQRAPLATEATCLEAPEPCIYCTIAPADPAFDPYCGKECAALAACEDEQ